MPVSIPISDAGTGPSPKETAFSAPVTQKSARPAASSTLMTRSLRPRDGWKKKVTRPAAAGTSR